MNKLLSEIWNRFKRVIFIWKKLPQPLRDKIIDLVIELYDYAFRGYYENQKSTKS